MARRARAAALLAALLTCATTGAASAALRARRSDIGGEEPEGASQLASLASLLQATGGSGSSEGDEEGSKGQLTDSNGLEITEEELAAEKYDKEQAAKAAKAAAAKKKHHAQRHRRKATVRSHRRAPRKVRKGKAKKGNQGTWRAEFSAELGKGQVGNFTIEVHPAWAPNGAKRFRELLDQHFFDGVRFFRVVPGFIAQFGIAGDPDVTAKWEDNYIFDDPRKVQNKRGYIAFAKRGANTRTTQMFINLKDNTKLDQHDFVPFGRVVSGMGVVDKIYGGYGDSAPKGHGPRQAAIRKMGNAYLDKDFPKLSFVDSARRLGAP